MEGDGLRAENEFLAFFWLVSRTTGESRVGNCVGFAAVVLTKIMREENTISRFTTRHRQNSGRFGLLDFILDGYFRV